MSAEITLFDTGFLLILFDPKARVPKGPDGKLVDRAQDRIDYLVQSLSKQRSKIVIPAPALAEFLLLASDRWIEYLTLIRKKSVFEIAGFDDLETVAHREICEKDGKLKAKQSGIETWAKMKYDRQIAAIAKTKRVCKIYSTDKDLYALAKKIDVECIRLWDLPLPPPKQEELQLSEEKEAQSGDIASNAAALSLVK